MVEWGVLLLAPLLAAAVTAGPVCTIDDERLDELSGLVATADGYIAVNDGADQASHRKIFYLDRDCSVAKAVSYPSRPRDTEDLQLGPDGTLWVGDIGDNGNNRDTVAVWKLSPGAAKPRLYRMSYPDGAHDAEALLIGADQTPIVVTKSAGSAGIYVPQGPLRSGGTTPLRRAGEVAVPFTTTGNPFSLAGRLVITGAAGSPDGTRVVLRTYADAFEYTVTGGDVVAALTSGAPRQIALPDEPQGEAVAYTADGTALLTVSEGARPVLRRYPLPAASPSASRRSAAAAPPASTPAARAAAPASDETRPPLVAILLALLAGTGAVLATAALLRRRAGRRT
ncbi:hypothetical protein FHX34_105367 [Actinoplanes teichomyceticus]|uniref:Esterase-like activity of phytase family protein n=1 Tax=Actinoplanes teichomyceticus TaxID=1867 RepID=A0A561VLM4_ACTTI|nr:hypothetical protein FHX34_105367 [Actinoplanes teichomyceticus]GIF13864.1 hypothetical protein Ate01nite_38960 [Actinoplanes teichomyceticus]